MKKHFFPVLSIFVEVLLLGSCKSTPIVFDESLSEDEAALIYWRNAQIYVVEYNGIPVKWELPSGQAFWGFGSFEITIPGGNTHFVLKGTTGSTNIGYTSYNDIPFDYNFEKGRQYTVAVNQWIINVYDGKSTSMKNHLETYNMMRGQTLTYQNGKKVNN